MMRAHAIALAVAQFSLVAGGSAHYDGLTMSRPVHNAPPEEAPLTTV